MDMTSVKYVLHNLEGYGAYGHTDLKTVLGKSVDTFGGILLRCTKGRAVVSANFNKELLGEDELAVLPYDTPFIPLSVSEDFTAEYIMISRELTDDIFYKVATSFWGFLYRHPILHQIGEPKNTLLEKWFEQTAWIIDNTDAHTGEEMTRNNLHNLFLAIEADVRKREEVSDFSKNKSWKLYNDFYVLLSRWHTKRRDVQFYAGELNVTPGYLFKIIKSIEGCSPKEVIGTFVTTAIKTYLRETELSIKNIATELHFDDPPYMCRFFHNNTGMSPIQYRNRIKKHPVSHDKG